MNGAEQYNTSGLFKECRVCKKVKPLSEFSKRTASEDGHRNDCKACNKEYREHKAGVVSGTVIGPCSVQDAGDLSVGPNPYMMLVVGALIGVAGSIVAMLVWR